MDDVQYGVTEDYFDAVLASDGIAVRMSDNVALVLAGLVARLVRFLEDGQLESRGGLRRGASPAKMLRRMFPDAYRGSAEARSFRERHHALLRDSAAARCVQARCATGTSYVINHAEVDDWLSTLGLARLLVVPRDTPTDDMTNTWLTHMQDCLVTALNPQLAGLTASWDHPPTIRRK
jgi:hypothetical protein